MKIIKTETERVESVAHNAESILDDLDAQFDTSMLLDDNLDDGMQIRDEGSDSLDDLDDTDFSDEAIEDEASSADDFSDESDEF